MDELKKCIAVFESKSIKDNDFCKTFLKMQQKISCN
jgi:hypothetical protein